MSDEGLREGWLANWLITERVTGLGGSCIQLTQSDMSAHGLIVVKEITHTHTHTRISAEITDVQRVVPVVVVGLVVVRYGQNNIYVKFEEDWVLDDRREI